MMIVVNILKTTAVDKLPSDLEGMEATMDRLVALIDDVYKYVDDVVVRSFTCSSSDLDTAISTVCFKLSSFNP